MDVDIKKRIKEHTAKLREHQAKADAKRARNAIDRMAAAAEARAADAAGPTEFRRVTLPQRMYDRLAAFLDSRSKLSEWVSPVTAYETKLRVRVELSRDAARAWERLGTLETGRPPSINVIDVEYDFRENGKVITPADHLRAQIALKEAEKALRTTEKDLQLTGLDQYCLGVEEEFQKVREDYEKWQKLLQRPAYFEKVSFRFSPRKGEEAGADGGEKRGRLERWFEAAGRMVKRNFAVAIAPFEAYYAYAAFSLITPDDHKLALTASIVFAVALGILGSIAGNLYLRSWRHRVTEGRIEARIHGRNAVLLGLTCIAAAALVVGGADLRSKIPHAQQWEREQADLKDAATSALRSPLDPDAPSNGAADDAAKAEQAVTRHYKERGEILAFDPRVDTSDEMIAYGIYLSVFLAAFCTWLFGRDPYNEYSLCAEALASLRRLRAQAATVRDGIEHDAQAERSMHEQLILDLKSRLWLLDRMDPIGLSPYADSAQRQANADAGELPPAAANAEATLTPEKARSSDHWLPDRVGRYARWFVRFGGTIREEDRKTIEQALEGRERA